jgi:hypothetical protein
MIDIPGIYLYNRYMTGIHLVYDKIYFPNKVHVCILLNGYMSSISTSNIYNEYSMHVHYFLKSYTVFKIAVVDDNHRP